MAVDHAAMQLILSPQLGLRVHCTHDKGRHLLTTRQFKAGEIVLAQQPYAAVLDAEHVSSYCDHCFLSKPDLLKCGRSQFARYCSRSHQKAAWDAGYKQECQAFVNTPPGRQPTATMRLAARAIWKAARARSQAIPETNTATDGCSHVKQWPAPGGSWQDVLALHHHWQLLPPHMQLVCAQVAAAARSFAASGLTGNGGVGPSKSATTEILPTASNSTATSDLTIEATAAETAQASSRKLSVEKATVDGLDEWEPDGLPSIKCIAQLIARFTSNCHTICDEELRPVGMGLYPLAALANHSCIPSCMQSFEGSTMTFTALRDLAVGDEVTIAYIDLAATLQNRREVLWEQYHFDVCAHAVTDEVKHNNAGSKGIASEVLRPEPLFGLQHSVNDVSWEVASEIGTQTMSRFMIYSSTQDNKHTYLPPWPCAKQDAALTGIEIQVSTAAGFTTLPGGLQAALNSRAASQLGCFFEGMMDEIGDEDSTTAIDSNLQSLTLSQNVQVKQPQQQQAGYPGCQIDCWGPWTQEIVDSNTAAGTGMPHTLQKGLTSIATNMDRICKQWWQAQQFAHIGQHSKAVTELKQALKLADSMTVTMHTLQLSCLDAAQSLSQQNEQRTVQLRLGPHHQLRMQLLAALLKAAIDGGSEWDVALLAAQQLTPIYEMALPRPWPWMGLHYATVAKLAAFQEQLQLALAAAEQALETLKITHGTGAWGQAGKGVLEQMARLRFEMQQELHAARLMS